MGDLPEYTSTPQKISDHRVIKATTGVNSTIFLNDQNQLYGLGNFYGLNGNSITSTPVLLFEETVLDFASGTGCYYVVKEDGSLWAGGHNRYGQLGDGTTANKEEFVQIFESGVISVNVRFESVAVIKDDGSLWTFGQNSHGKLGNGTADNVSVPQRLCNQG